MYTVKYNANSAPSNESFRAKMNVLFLMYTQRYRDDLSGVLSAGDVKVMDEFVAQQEDMHAELANEISRRRELICEQRKYVDAAGLVAQFVGIEKNYQRTIEKRYRTTIAKLSNSGMQSVLRFVEREIEPYLSITVLDTQQLYSDFPELLASELDLYCSGSQQEFAKAAAKRMKSILDAQQEEQLKHGASEGFGATQE